MALQSTVRLRTRAAASIVAVAMLSMSLLAVGCTSTQPKPASPAPEETPQAANLDAAIATASKSVSDASTYVFSLKQPLPDAPPSDDLEELQSTLNAAATQDGAAQRATAQRALDQFNAGITKSEDAANSAPQDQATQDQYVQLVETLAIGRDALDRALLQ